MENRYPEAEILNLGCGIRPSDSPRVVNIDWSPTLRIAKSPMLRRVAPLFLDSVRLGRVESMPDNILPHDLRKGIPFADESVSAVYHSHVLEHIDREHADGFMAEIHRVLRPGGLQRVVVPDLEVLVRRYLESLDGGSGNSAEHDDLVAGIIEQSVRREAQESALKGPLRRRMENVALGDARKRGETHQWMYDRLNLAELLERNGFFEVTRRPFDSSAISGWDEIGRGLDFDEEGREFRSHSLYMEAVKAA